MYGRNALPAAYRGQCRRVGILRKIPSTFQVSTIASFFKNILISRKIKVCLRYRCEGEYPAVEFIIFKSIFNCVSNTVNHDDVTE